MAHWNEDGRLAVTEEDYDTETAKQFIRDALKCGLEPYHYNGRCCWEGPAVDVSGAGDFCTKVGTRQDSMGKGLVVYPNQSAQMITEEPEYPEDDDEE